MADVPEGETCPRTHVSANCDYVISDRYYYYYSHPAYDPGWNFAKDEVGTKRIERPLPLHMNAERKSVTRRKKTRTESSKIVVNVSFRKSAFQLMTYEKSNCRGHSKPNRSDYGQEICVKLKYDD